MGKKEIEDVKPEEPEEDADDEEMVDPLVSSIFII